MRGIVSDVSKGVAFGSRESRTHDIGSHRGPSATRL